MQNFFGIKYGTYILYEVPTQSHNINETDINIKSFTSYEDVLKVKFGLEKVHVEYLLKNGAEILVYVENGTPLGIACAISGSCYVRGPGIPLIQDAKSVYWFWAYTLPEARGKNVFTKIQNSLIYRYRNATSIRLLTEPTNSIINREMKKLNATDKIHYHYLKIKNISIVKIVHTYDKKHDYKIYFGNTTNLVTL